MLRMVVRSTIIAIAFAPLSGHAQSGGFLTKLGNDTIAVEQYSRSGGRILGTLVRRLPATVVVRYQMTLNADGTVATFEQSAGHADGSSAPNSPPGGKITFVGDSLTREVQSGAPASTLRAAAPKGIVPSIGLSWLSFQLQLEAARKYGTAHTMGLTAAQQGPAKVDVRFFDPDSAEIVFQGFRTGVKMDQNGHVLRADGSLTTQKFIIIRDSNLDALSIARAWEARESAGGALGVASPRDTVKAVVGDANVVIDYGRPAKRGRAIWGGLVPYDTTWRLGANSATQLRTDKDLDIGGSTVRAGFYSLWLYPTAEKAWLVVNSQTGQWGTEYDSTKNVVRIPLQIEKELPEVEERFHIFVKGDSLKLLWDRGGYAAKIAKR
ncbi:MAG: DUF2911 domain-containing protein [Gemmatimonadaceae bacterium]